MKLRFQADADLKRAIVLGLQRYSSEVDFRTAESVPLAGPDDFAVLGFAAEQNRVLVSHDQNTMQTHLRRFLRQKQSPGVILIPQRIPTGVAIEGLYLIWEALTSSDLENRIC